ncbi:hypothetical protein AB0M64_10360 [Streptomyces sp. NPDC051771]|uniref:hypothetical protein n=1 Tax=Streptomyces sp. NPDC051771 TaxID=3154847 RepID=UPI003430C430
MTHRGSGRGRGRRTTRGCAATALAALIGLTATGCSPALRPLVAVYVDEHGTPQALLRSCEDDGTIRGPWLDITPDPPAKATALSSARPAPENGWWTSDTRKAEDIPLFSPPAHWDAETSGPLTLRPGVTYELSLGDPDDTYAYAAEVTFRAADLTALPPGSVLALDGETTREEFEDRARDAC